MAQQRRSGSAKTLRVVFSGDPQFEAPLRAALSASGQQDRWTHHFHTWPAGLHPDAAQALIPLLPQGRILDPFLGGGTTLVEAMANGHETIGRDISPIALKIAKTRTSLVADEVLTQFRSAARAIADQAKTADRPPPAPMRRVLQEWYQPHVLAELEAIRLAIQAAPQEIRPLLEACFSSILVKTSFRKSDTVNKRVPYKRERASTAILFHKKARELGRRLAAFREAVPDGTPAADIRHGDATRLKGVGEVAGILTSPPYPGVYDYLPLQLLRNIWLGVGPPKKNSPELGTRRSFQRDAKQARWKWIKGTEAWTSIASELLAPDGRMVVLIGDGFVRRRPFDTVKPSLQAARSARFEVLARATAERPDKIGGLRKEHLFVFEKRAKPPGRRS